MDSSQSISSKVGNVKRGLFYSQVVAILIVIIACVVNLSLGSANTELWASLLSGSLGYLLPTPKLRNKYRNDSLLLNSTEQQLHEILPRQQDKSFRNSSSNSD